MTILVIIIAVAAITAIFFFIIRKKKIAVPSPPSGNTALPLTNNPAVLPEIDKEAPIFTDNEGRQYIEIQTIKERPRKTWLIGTLSGKYWGELDLVKDGTYEKYKFYDFNIYEAEIVTRLTSDNCHCLNTSKTICNGFHRENEGTFDFQPDSAFPREKLPPSIHCLVKEAGSEKAYTIIIHEPRLGAVKFNRLLHQHDDQEVFGTINAEITGYVLDFISEPDKGKKYLSTPPEHHAESQKTPQTNSLTGNIQFKNGYRRLEHFNSDYKTASWGAWKYYKSAGSTQAENVLVSFISLITLVISIFFFLLVLPRIVILLPFILFPILLSALSLTIIRWLAKILMLGIISLCLFVILKFSLQNIPSRSPVVKRNIKMFEPHYELTKDTLENNIFTDTLISHYATWYDYDSTCYDGKIWIKNSDLSTSSLYKNNIQTNEASERGYDEMLHSIKNNDKGKLEGLFQLFDTIHTRQKLTANQFAEMAASFIQQIPYSIVLPGDCNPDLYNDIFLKTYLTSENALCDAYERYGIYTPVELLATMRGDCDSRTLLLYTILDHYNYDVALLSSKYYRHSLIGINLPYKGTSFHHATKQYILWETTSPGARPGMIPNEIANLKYWRISLKSK